MSLLDPLKVSLAGLETVLGKFAVYIIAFFFLLSIVLGCGWYVSNLKLQVATTRADKIRTQLQVSNGSVESLETEYKKITGVLEKNELLAAQQRSAIITKIDDIDSNSKQAKALEASLLSRPSGPNAANCPVPKDLLDAYDQM